MKVTAHACRSGRWWAVEIFDVPEVGALHTQARRLDQIPAMAADAVASVLEIDPASVEVDVEVVAEI